MVLGSQIITALSLAGTTLDALGGLYLTYDLLGFRYGPLRTLTSLVTSGVLCGACFWPLLGLWFGVAGAAALGPLLVFEYVRHAKHGAESRGAALAFQAIRAVVLGIAGWLTIDMRFGVAFGLASALALVALYWLHFSPADTYRSSRSPQLGARIIASAAARSARFYIWLMETQPCEWTYRYVTFICPKLNLNSVLLASDGKELYHDTLYHFGIALADKGAVVNAYHRAGEAGWRIEKPPRAMWTGRPLHRLWLKDPDGNLIEIYARLTAEELTPASG